MKIPSIWTAAPLGAAVLFPLAASAELFQGPFGPGGTWNVYETVTTATTFKDALEAATASKFDPVTGTVDPGGSVAGNLVSVLSQGENDMIAKNLLPTANVWIGLSDRVGVAPGATESQVFGSPGNLTNGWAWTTGETFSFNAWGGGEPNDAGGEDAAHIRNDGLWNDNTSGYGLNEPVADEHSTAEGAATAFRVVEYRTESATPIAGIKVGSALPAPGTLNAPAGGFGTWGVREVTGLTLAGNIRDSVDLIQSGAGTAHLAQLPKLDVTDPDTNAAGGPVLGGTPIPFLSNTAEDDNNILTAARGTVQVTEAGTYTIQVRSDDGFALRVVGQQFDSVNGLGYIDPVDPSTIAFHTGTGDANTRGIITLAAGTYDVEFIAWEGGGGAYYEVSSTKGAITDTSGTPAQWLALGDGSIQDAIVPTVRLSSPATVTNAAAPEGQQVTTLAGGRDALANATTTYTREVSVVSITDAQMPIEQQAGVIDDYGTSVIGKITVDNGAGASNETLGITFGLRADDGASLRIVGQSFLSINDFDGGENNIAVLLEEGGDQTMVADYLTGDTNAWGYIELTEGEYDFIAYQFERGGGSNINLWWALGDHTATGDTGAQGFQRLTTATPGNIGLGLVPEPGSALLGLSALTLLFTRRRRS